MIVRLVVCRLDLSWCDFGQCSIFPPSPTLEHEVAGGGGGDHVRLDLGSVSGSRGTCAPPQDLQPEHLKHDWQNAISNKQHEK